MRPQFKGDAWIRSSKKRCVDLVLCALITPPALCVFLISSALILLFEGRPVIFNQQRIGKDGARFTIYKLHTIRPDMAQRSRLGELLGILGADETPQILYNIWRGDMAVIGARPLIEEDFERMYATLGAARYEEWYRAYTACRPGWMGAFSCPSRRYVSQSDSYMQARHHYDVKYHKTACCGRDIAIFLQSLTMWCADMDLLRRALVNCISAAVRG